MLRFCLFVGLICLIGGAEVAEEFNVNDGRIPKNLYPLHYNIELRPDIYRSAPPLPFDGNMELWLRCDAPTDRLYLQAVNITVDSASLFFEVAADSPVQAENPIITGWMVDTDLQFVILFLDRQVTLGAHYHFKASFSSVLQPSTERGFYWDYYTKEGVTKYIAVTQFESYFTRRAFPCFDEPGFRSTFNVTLVHRPGYTSLSNTLQTSVVHSPDGWDYDYFEKTPYAMPIYLLAFFVGADYTNINRTLPNGQLVRIWAREEVIQNAVYADSVAWKVTEWFENYTGIPYSWPKTDHIAYPTKGGAMENWGLITYGETSLLHDPAWDTFSQKRRVANIIAHELAHQWFGNLVTCAWWNDTWLNEGFANFFEFTPLEDVLGWPNSVNQVSDNIYGVMDTDSLNTSLPVRMQVESPWEAPSTFGSPTYNKGGAVLRMIQQVLTPETLRRGLQLYLTRHSYSNTDTDDLWAALNEQAAMDNILEPDGTPLDVKQRFDPWVNQIGYPLVTVSVTPQSVGLIQAHYLNPADQIVSTPSPYNYTWSVPITITTEDSPDNMTSTEYWFGTKTGEFTSEVPSTPDIWVLLNIGQTGFYRVKYSSQLETNIVRQLLADHLVIHRESRAQLINDAFSLARAGLHSETVGMDVTRYLGNDNSYVPWEVLNRHLDYPTTMLGSYGLTYGRYENYLHSIVEPVYLYISSILDLPEYDKLFKTRMVALACTYGVRGCIDYSVNAYRMYQENSMTNTIVPDYRSTVYCTAIAVGSAEDWDFAYSQFTMATRQTEKNYLLGGMGCSKESWILQRYLDILLNGAETMTISTADVMTGVRALIQNNVGRYIVFDHLSTEWSTTALGSNKLTIFQEVVATFSTQDDLMRVERFIEMNPAQNQNEMNAYNAALKSLNKNLAWINNNLNDLDSWLQMHMPTQTQVVQKCASCARVGKLVDMVDSIRAVRGEAALLKPLKFYPVDSL